MKARIAKKIVRAPERYHPHQIDKANVVLARKAKRGK